MISNVELLHFHREAFSLIEADELWQGCHDFWVQFHMQCSVKIAKLEAQVAEYLAFMERFRTSLQREEHGTQP